MKKKQVIPGLSALVMAAGFSLPANAEFVVLDGWQLTSNTGTTTNIGRLNLTGGSASVYQEVDAGHNVFVGARFVEESRNIRSVSYTPESVVGPLDPGGGGFGGPSFPLQDAFTISFSNVSGVVDTLVGSGFHFVFNSGNYSISAANGGSASGSIVGLDGTSGSTNTANDTTGTTTFLGNILSTASIFDFKDSGGVSLLPQLATGQVLFQATTHNRIFGAFSRGAFGPCPFDSGATCARIGEAAMVGEAYLVGTVAAVPEPGTYALMAAGLGALGFVGRRRRHV